MITSLHNHTAWSDGKAGVTQMLAKAGELGIDELGIADHYVLRPGGEPPSWSIPADRLEAYVAELVRLRNGAEPVLRVDAEIASFSRMPSAPHLWSALNREILDGARATPAVSLSRANQICSTAGRELCEVIPAPTLRIGIEVDWFPGNAEGIAAVLEGQPFDFVIGSVHEIGDFILDASAESWQELTEEQRNRYHRAYWQHLRSLAESGLFDIVGHLDLPKKFGGRPTVCLDDEINTALDAIASAGLVVELNTAGWHWPCQDAYPSLDLLQRCRERGIKTMLAADAHRPDHLLRDFDRGCARLRAAGYRQVARFARRELHLTDLPQL